MNKGIITVDSTGLLEVFYFNMKVEKHQKLSEFNINKGVTNPVLNEQITNMCLNEDASMLAISTINNADAENGCILSRLLVFKIDGKGRLNPYV